MLQRQSTQGDFSLQASKAENCQLCKFHRFKKTRQISLKHQFLEDGELSSLGADYEQHY
jgi:hypothetical protein